MRNLLPAFLPAVNLISRRTPSQLLSYRLTATCCTKPQYRTMSVPGTNNLTKAEETPRDLVQYIVVRGDLNEWGTGALMAQAVHAGIAAIWDARTEEDVTEYCSRRGDNAGIHPQMRTVLLKAETEIALLDQVNYLKEVGVRHVLWTEMPEGIPTALAARPYPVDVVKPHFKKFRLFK